MFSKFSKGLIRRQSLPRCAIPAIILFTLCCLSGLCYAQSADDSPLQVRTRVFIESALGIPIHIVSVRPLDDGVIRLLSKGSKEETTRRIEVVVETIHSQAPLAMVAHLDSGGEEVVSVPIDPILLVATDNERTRRTSEFIVEAVNAGNTAITIILTDPQGNRGARRIRVEVIEPLQIAAPTEAGLVELQCCDGVAATTQIAVVVETVHTDTSLTITVHTDDELVVSIPSDPIVLLPTGQDDMRYSAGFVLTAEDIGRTTVTIVVTDNLNNRDTVDIGVAVLAATTTNMITTTTIVPENPLRIVSPTEGTLIRLENEGETKAMERVIVIAETAHADALLTMTVHADDNGSAAVSIPSDPIVLISTGQDDMRHSAGFVLTAEEAGRTTVTIVVTDDLNNRDTVDIGVAVVVATTIVPENPLRIVSPTESTLLRLTNEGETKAMGQVIVIAETAHADAVLTMTVHADDNRSVVSIPSGPIVLLPTGQDDMRRRAGFVLTAEEAGRTTVTIVVTDNLNNRDTVNIGAIVTADDVTAPVDPQDELQIIRPAMAMVFNPLNGGGSAATTQVEVVAINVTTSATVTVRLDSGGEAVASIPKDPIALIPSQDSDMYRTQFALKAIGAGHTTATLTVIDALGNSDEVRIRVVVEAIAGSQCVDCPMTMILPPGIFMMGSPIEEANSAADERPQHRVDFPYAFEVGRYEVTRGEFKEFIDATGHDAENCWRNPGIYARSDENPVTCISWDDAQAYIRWLSAKTGQEYRLLSEAEWEYVARAGTTTPYYFGTTITPQQASYFSHTSGTVVVGLYPANRFGLHDVHGNAWEWVEDCWHPNYNGAPSDGSAWNNACTEENARVIRGGSYLSRPEFLRSANRSRRAIADRVVGIGFRVARTLNP